MATIMYPSLTKSQSMRSKRKSAVELLAESKAFYVKSETVRDSQQVLPLRVVGPCSVPLGGGGGVYVRARPALVTTTTTTIATSSAMASWRTAPPPQCDCGGGGGQGAVRRSVRCEVPPPLPPPGWFGCSEMAVVSPSRSLPPLRVSNGRRSTSACSDVLQNKLRKLLNGDSRENMSSETGSSCLVVEDFTPISPPAEYAITERSSYRYAPQGSPDRVVHKSLPDLHSSQQQQQQQQQQTVAVGQGSNRSASNKSLSNRDSGESSGHYTHRSEPAPCTTSVIEPPPRPEVRRDSGSSTQHSGYGCCEAVVYSRGGYMAPSSRAPGYELHQQQQPPQYHHRVPPPPLEYTGNVAAMPYQDPTLSPGPGTFKRQKCFRYKQRDRSADSRPILRSKSDISDRYWRGGSCGVGVSVQRKSTGGVDPPLSHLEQFFEQLGLNSDSYESMVDTGCASDSPVFFSDVSTVDSGRPLDPTDYCAPPLRPSEPPSIVERNARIIKWLCNCRKLQISGGGVS